MNESVKYDLKSVKVPRMSGKSLQATAKIIEHPLLKHFVMGHVMKEGGITRIRKLIVDDPPTYIPLHMHPKPKKTYAPPDITELVQTPREKDKGFAFSTIEDYARAYRSGKVTPEETAHKVIESIEKCDKTEPALRAFIAYKREDIMKQAEQSSKRFAKGKPLGVLDGVPVAVKDEIDQIPYGTTVGTRFLGKTPAGQDATVVKRLRDAGAVLIGKTNMHEIGIGVTGLNPHHGTVRNPYNPDYYTGGSSSGSAAAVAAGLCPVAIGADGGGSIRIPAAFCGVVGLKPTYGRVSEFGAAPLDWSVAHLGPIGASALDAALAYAIMAGPDPKDNITHHQPQVTLKDFLNLDLHSLKLGVYWKWFSHASQYMVQPCEELLKSFVSMGAHIVDIEIPELEPARVAHVITIISEMAAAMGPYYDEHLKDFGLDVRINLALARSLTSRDYVHAQRIRTRAIEHFSDALKKVDLIITPATGCTAPLIPKDALPDGESDLSVLAEIMRFATPPNLTGLPAISFPAGYDNKGLPVGFQAIGKPWGENVLLGLAHAAEKVVSRKKPFIHKQILPLD
jgi:Asp-tRNA(Asn)/Glu-tRNA(Gln) amidotransferase A subunit family amidase